MQATNNQGTNKKGTKKPPVMLAKNWREVRH
jgi:hypothetical protein